MCFMVAKDETNISVSLSIFSITLLYSYRILQFVIVIFILEWP